MPKKENFSHISVRNRTVRPRGWPNQSEAGAGVAAWLMPRAAAPHTVSGHQTWPPW